MSEEQNENQIEVYESPVFSKAIKRLPEAVLEAVEDAIDKVVDNPEIGVQKKGDLSYMRVYKFSVERQQFLLGYSWQEERLTLYLLNLGPHENFYRDAKKRRPADKKLIDD
ncbi:MAG: type II toxin-antitoxin system RelE/ParE family toxin [Oceanospirillaceae bacterium]|uniref:type II toxin-antitoxin system RelE/ParE family toxin n=1 Tax=Marinobacterium litorale TaxID=404770 RepID=UPI00041D72CE|nr:type II toxin-antitoxin system RelE/ParE family toxin [Marinobacterium litorale]MBS97290.1 type II toxin-antitoxin system RelE/ParE family toxin [Oceanospirillaceae bacterium]